MKTVSVSQEATFAGVGHQQSLRCCAVLSSALSGRTAEPGRCFIRQHGLRKHVAPRLNGKCVALHFSVGTDSCLVHLHITQACSDQSSKNSDHNPNLQRYYKITIIQTCDD